MNEIKIYLKTSGSFAELYKDFNLYQGCYRNSQISVYVPRSILYANAENTFANPVKVGGILTAPNGTKLTTKSYYLDYVKEETVNTIAYAVYTTITPKEFCVYAGTQTVVVNVENIDNTNAEAPTILSVTTTQTANLIVLESAYLGQDEPIDPTELEKLRATLTVIQENVTELQTSVRGLQGEVSGIQIDLEQVHTDLGNRVEKTTLTYSLYGTDKNGNQAIIPYGTTGLGNSIPQYTADSEIRIPASPTQSYYAANKGYVDKGLQEKLDKTGGEIHGDLLVGGELRVLDDTIIIGNLTVQGTTITEDAETIMSKANVIVTNSEGAPLTQLSGIGIRTNATPVYGIMYDPGDDTVKLGEGTLDANNEFTFNSGEGTAVATRADSAMWTNGHLSMWNAAEYRFVDSGIAADNVVTVNTAQQITGAKTFAQAVRVGTGNVYASYYTGGVIWRDSNGNDHANIFPAGSGTLALTSDIPTDYVTQEEFEKAQRSIEDIYTILGQTVILWQSLTQEYTTRETAAGLDIIDGALTEVKEIRGKTVATENLIPYPYEESTKTENGITFTVNSDGSITANGTTTVKPSIFNVAKISLNAGTYALRSFVNVANAGICQFYIDIPSEPNDRTGNGVTFTLQDDIVNKNVNIIVNPSQTVNNLVFRPMLNAGTTAKPYSKWFAGLKNASFEKIVSTGRNLIPFPYAETTKTANGVTFTVNSDGSVTVNGTATARTVFFIVNINKFLRLSQGVSYRLSGCPAGGGDNTFSLTVQDITYSQTFNDVGNGESGVTRFTDYYAFITIFADYTANNLIFRPMLNIGTTALPYEPYISDTFSAETPIELPEYDVAYPETGETKRQSNTITFNGTEDWYLVGNTENNFYNYRYYVPIPVTGSKTKAPCICNKYDYKLSVENDMGNDIGILAIGDYVYIRLGSGSMIKSVTEWKAYLAAQSAAGNPLTVTYKTAEATTEVTPFNKSRYQAWDGGSETIYQGTNDNSEYGAENTVVQNYATKRGGTTE